MYVLLELYNQSFFHPTGWFLFPFSYFLMDKMLKIKKEDFFLTFVKVISWLVYKYGFRKRATSGHGNLFFCEIQGKRLVDKRIRWAYFPLASSPGFSKSSHTGSVEWLLSWIIALLQCKQLFQKATDHGFLKKVKERLVKTEGRTIKL